MTKMQILAVLVARYESMAEQRLAQLAASLYHQGFDDSAVADAIAQACECNREAIAQVLADVETEMDGEGVESVRRFTLSDRRPATSAAVH